MHIDRLNEELRTLLMNEARGFALSKQMKSLILNMGYNEKDFAQIQRAGEICKFTFEEKPISIQQAMKILPLEDFISGLARAAFHWTSSRATSEGKVVSFDCSKLFESVNAKVTTSNKSLNEDLSAKANKLINTINKKMATSEYGTSTILGVKNLSRSDLESIIMYAEMIRDTGSYDGFMSPMGAEKEVLQKAGLLESVNEDFDTYAVAWTEFNRQDQIITKRKEFSSEKARDNFIKRLKEKPSFNEIIATSEPQGSASGIKEAMERYLSVEYNEADPDKQTLVLYNGPAVVDSEVIDLEDPLHTQDQEIRDIAKNYFDNITDDIRVVWY